MKVLKILKEHKYSLDCLIKSDVVSHLLKQTNEAIEELETLQNRSCNNCKHWELGWCFKLGSSLDIGGCGDYWEQK